MAALRCDDCVNWMYDFRNKRWSKAGGKRVKRPVGTKPPCWQCPKCQGVKAATPANGEKAELSERNMQALTAYYEHEQGDRLTRRVFGLIRRVMDSHDRSLQHNIMELLTVSRL